MIIDEIISNLKRIFRIGDKFVDHSNIAIKGSSDTFCILAFNHLHISPNGTVKMCCIAGGNISNRVLKNLKIHILVILSVAKNLVFSICSRSFTSFRMTAKGVFQHLSKEGSDLSIYNVTYEEIWNSEYMLSARHAMSKGIRVRACERCYREEEIVGTSRRLLMNEHWLSQSSLSPKEIFEIAGEQGWRVKARPIFLQLNMGNFCNLACRMCSSEYSSRISGDPVHSKWMPAPYISDSEINRFHKPGGWWSQKELIFGEILSEPREVRRIIFQGGEPLIIKEFGEILDYLIKEEAEDNVVIELTTNMTKVSDKLINQLKSFKRVELGCSIDGIGAVLEYIRYPAKWDKIKDNLNKFADMKNIILSFNVAIQAYNLMTITDLYRYCDENNILVCAHFLAGPAYLHVLVLPISARKIALERLNTYINGSPAPENIASAKYLVHFLEQHSDIHHIEQIRPFMLFTNDMDVSRNQCFSETYPELIKLFSEEGYPWINETLHIS